MRAPSSFAVAGDTTPHSLDEIVLAVDQALSNATNSSDDKAATEIPPDELIRPEVDTHAARARHYDAVAVSAEGQLLNERVPISANASELPHVLPPKAPRLDYQVGDTESLLR